VGHMWMPERDRGLNTVRLGRVWPWVVFQVAVFGLAYWWLSGARTIEGRPVENIALAALLIAALATGLVNWLRGLLWRKHRL